MKLRLTSFLFALLLCLLLVACRPSLKDEITATLANIDVSEYTAASIMVPNYSTPSQYTNRFPEEYARIAVYGEENVSYILEYVIDHEELNYLNAMFFVCCAYNMLGMDGFLDVDLHRPIEHARALQAYLP